MYFDTTLNKPRIWSGSAWLNLEGNGVTSVGATAPIASSGGQAPTISISPATQSAAGSMSAADKTKLDGATAINTASAIVQRDSSGNIAATTVTGNLTGTASNASNLNNQAPSFYTNRANHTGTQTASTISDFDSSVRSSRLDQMAAPTTSLSLNAQRITGLADPQNAQDAVTKAYADALSNGLDVKQSVRVATTANINLSAPGTAIDGVTLANGDRVLVMSQTTASQNGLYVFNGSATAMTRSADADANAEVTAGLFVFVEEGTTNADAGFTLTTNNPIVVGTTALAFAQFSGAGQITAGAGLVKTGNQLAVGAGTGIVVSTGTVAIDTGVVVRKFSQNLGDGTSTAIAITHNLNSRDVTWQVYLNSGTFDDVIPDAQRTSANVLTLLFATPPTANQYRVVVHV
jgi:hypothetical protein